MSDEEGFVSFKVNQWDRDNEFNINRPKKRMSKNQATYGIWADSDSDEDSGKKGFGNAGGSKSKDYSAPVAFVSGGVKGESKQKSESGFQNDTKKNKKSAPSMSSFSGFAGLQNFGSHSGHGEFANWEAHTKGIGSKLLQKMGYQPGKGLGKNLQGITAPIEAKKRPGFGAIGLYGPEMTEQAKATERQLADKEKSDDIEVIDIDDDSKEIGWKKSKTEMTRKEKKVKIYTKSTDEIISDSVKNSWNSNKTNNDFQRMKIIDMTGPKQKVLSGLSQLHQSKAEKPKDDYNITAFNTRFDMPELKSNIERLVRLSESKLIKCDKDYYRDQDQIDNLSEEKARLSKLLSQEKVQLSVVDKFEIFVEKLEQKVGQNELTLEQAIFEFENFSTADVRLTLRTLGFDNLIICTVGSLLGNQLNSWQPFSTSNEQYVEMFQRLKAITFKNKTFEIILWDYWIPPVCRSLQQWPSMKHFEEIIAFIERWKPLLPKWLFEYFVGNNLIPRIMREVEDWNPLTDILPIHSWIHPWLPVLLVGTSNSEHEERSFLFESIYEIIRMKLANALTNWHPSDSSARLILEPWKGVFTEASFQTFLEINIVPKLSNSMQSLVINPSQQIMDQWNWVLSWKNLLSFNTMVNILEKHFFPNWLNVLYGWLNSGVANFAEIGLWYQGWKSFIPDDLVNHPVIKDLLKKALMMMDHAVNLATGLKQFSSYYDPSQARPHGPMGSLHNPIEIPGPAADIIQQKIEQNVNAYQAETTLSFKEMVERKANENGILFMPIANRQQDSKQVYQFDQFLIYIDNQVIFQQKFVQTKRLWVPVRLQELIELCAK